MALPRVHSSTVSSRPALCAPKKACAIVMSRKGAMEYAANSQGRLFEDKGVSKLIRTCGVAGTPAFIKRLVPRLRNAGMAVEAISVVPSMRGNLAARIAGQDEQDALRVALAVPFGVAPEVLHAQDAYEYVFIGAPTHWRAELAEASLRNEKCVVCCAPPPSSEIAKLVAGTHDERLLLHNPLRWAPAVAALREAVAEERFGPAESLSLSLALDT